MTQCWESSWVLCVVHDAVLGIMANVRLCLRQMYRQHTPLTCICLLLQARNTAITQHIHAAAVRVGAHLQCPWQPRNAAATGRAACVVAAAVIGPADFSCLRSVHVAASWIAGDGCVRGRRRSCCRCGSILTLLLLLWLPQ